MTSTTMTRREELEKLVADMRAKADEVDAKGGPTAEDREELDKMGKATLELVEGLKAAAIATGTIDVAKAFLGGLAGEVPTPDPQIALSEKSGIVNPNGMTLGEALSKSPAYEEFLGQFKGSDGQIRSTSGTMKSMVAEVPGFNQKTLVTGGSATSGGAFIVPERPLGVTDLVGARKLYVRDLCTNINITSDSFSYVTITAKTNNAAAVVEASSSAPDTTYGTHLGSNVQGYKPESAMTLAVVNSVVQTIAHFIPITRRAAADAPQMRGLVDAFLLFGLKLTEEDQILNGTGTSPQLTGIMNTAGIQTVGSAGTDLDAVVDAIAAVRNAFRDPNALVIHPGDWYSTGFLLAKDSTGHYLVGDPGQSVDQLQSLWGLRVVVTPAQTQNTALVGDFKQAVVADRQQSAIYVTDSNRDWFERNLLAILAEERLGFGILDPRAFCTISAV